ncbi:MAG: exodeoxyribonuclease III [Verrucomicrobiales bacterium]|nr:exodeoxyribonuclease III [Verrucomicrobiales bacterium]
MKLISWNVNGIRAALKKDFVAYAEAQQPDILCVQETKAHPDQVEHPVLAGYHDYWNSAEKKGYSGTAVFSKTEPINVTQGLGIPEHDNEGRVLTLEYPDFYLVNVYTPNSQNELRRLAYRQSWDAAFLVHLVALEKTKPVIFTGDLNVAHQEIDLARPKQNRRNPGFSDEERAGFDNILAAGFIDSFRHLHPDEEGHYSWWSYRAGARGNNVGWRLDYFGISPQLLPALSDATIHSETLGSDHCPVVLELDL